MKNNLTVLIVDDDEGICRLIEKNLVDESYTIKCAHTGRAALDLCRAEENPFLLLDYRLSDMTGEEVITTLFGEGIHIPFVIITGQGDEKIAVEMMKLGASDYITKDVAFIDKLPSVINRAVAQVRTERRLAESEETLRFTQFAMEKFSDATYWMGRDAHFIYVNEAACRALGYSREELLSMTVHDIDPEFPREVWAGHWGEIKERESFIINTTHRRKDGTIFPVEISLNFVEFAGKEFSCAFARDITDRVKAEDALRDSEARARIFMDAFPEQAFIADLKGTVLISNSSSIDAGLEPGTKCCKVQFGLDEICSWCLAPQAVSSGNPEQKMVEHEGRYLDIHWVPVGEDSFLHYTFDITEKIKSEREKKELEKQVQHAQKLESLGVLAGGIAHDFNNLLVGILGNAGIAAMKLGPESPAVDTIRKIETAAQRAAELTNQMLAYSGKGRFVVVPVDLNKLIEEMGHLLQAAVAKSAVIRYCFADGLPAIEVDSSQIRQIVMNLITNASDAVADTSGVVTITTGTMECDSDYLSETFLDENLTEGTYVFMEISDTGHGMDKETQAKIFDPFFTTKPTGRGLGMAAVLGIVRGHNGAIKLYSEPGKGTTFKVLFPMSDKQYTEKTLLPTALIDWKASGTILVVDDEETVLDLAETILSDFGFTVLTAPDGREGLKVFRENPDRIDLVILDMTMPHMGGVETFREMRRAKKDVKVILSSGFSEEDATTQFNGKGLMGFIQKPYLPVALIDKVKEALEG